MHKTINFLGILNTYMHYVMIAILIIKGSFVKIFIDRPFSNFIKQKPRTQKVGGLRTVSL